MYVLFQALNSGDNHKLGVSAEDLLRCTKAITQATAKAVAAGNSNKQDDIIAAANMGRKAISDMLIICKVSSNCITIYNYTVFAFQYIEVLQILHIVHGRYCNNAQNIFFLHISMN